MLMICFKPYIRINSKITPISYDYITEYVTKWYDVAINSTMKTCILLVKF